MAETTSFRAPSSDWWADEAPGTSSASKRQKPGRGAGDSSKLGHNEKDRRVKQKPTAPLWRFRWLGWFTWLPRTNRGGGDSFSSSASTPQRHPHRKKKKAAAAAILVVGLVYLVQRVTWWRYGFGLTSRHETDAWVEAGSTRVPILQSMILFPPSHESFEDWPKASYHHDKRKLDREIDLVLDRIGETDRHIVRQWMPDAAQAWRGRDCPSMRAIISQAQSWVNCTIATIEQRVPTVDSIILKADGTAEACKLKQKDRTDLEAEMFKEKDHTNLTKVEEHKGLWTRQRKCVDLASRSSSAARRLKNTLSDTVVRYQEFVKSLDRLDQRTRLDGECAYLGRVVVREVWRTDTGRLVGQHGQSQSFLEYHDKLFGES